MINVSNAFQQELYKGNRNFLEYVDITLKSGEVLNLTNKDIWGGGFTIDDAVSRENSFDIGATIINQFTCVINNIYDEFSDYDFTDAKVIPYIGLELPDGMIEKLQKGVFYVNETKYNGSIITLTCYDNMAKFDRPYSESTLTYPATLDQIVRDACSKCDVTLQTYDFPHNDFVVDERPADEAITFREVIGWVAQIACCFTRCDRYGRLELKWFNTSALDNGGLDGGFFDDDNPYSSGDDADGGTFNPWNTGYVHDAGEFSRLESFHHIYSHYSMNISTDDVVITGVKVLEKAPDDSENDIITYMTGQEGYVITIEGNDLIKNGAGQTIVGWIGQAIIGLHFRKADFQHTSDPTIEAGDIGVLTDRKQRSYYILISATTFSIGNSQSTRSSAEDPLKNSAARFSNATKNYVEYRKEIKKEKTDREQAISDLTDKMNNSSGLYTTEETQADGSTIFYMHDKPTLGESQIVWKMTAEAWAVSTDGGKTFNGGMTVDGDTITRILSATGINADWIKTGQLVVSDSAGEIFNVNLSNAFVGINSDLFFVGETPNRVIKEYDGFRMTFSEDYIRYEISRDDTGLGDHFWGASSKIPIKIYYGALDVTDECSISVDTRGSGTVGYYRANREVWLDSFWGSGDEIQVSATYLNAYRVNGSIYVQTLQSDDIFDHDIHYMYRFFDAGDIKYPNGPVIAGILRIQADGTPEYDSIHIGIARTRSRQSDEPNVYYIAKTWETNTAPYTEKIIYKSTNAENEMNINISLDMPEINFDHINEIEITAYKNSDFTTILCRKVILVVNETSYPEISDEDKFNYLFWNEGVAKVGDYLYGEFRAIKADSYLVDDAMKVTGEITFQNPLSSTHRPLRISVPDGIVSGGESDIDDNFVRIYEGRIYFHTLDQSPDFLSYQDAIYHDLVKQATSTLKSPTLVLNSKKQICLAITDDGIREALYVYSTNPNYSLETYVIGNFSVAGQKHRSVFTENYDERLLCSYETPSPMFGDIGTGKIDEKGICYVTIEDIFSETISQKCEYYVFLQKEGQGDLWVDSKEPTFFVVKGTPGLKFSYEIKARQKDYEFDRLEIHGKGVEPTINVDYIESAENYVKKIYRELEEIAYDEEINELHAAYDWRG